MQEYNFDRQSLQADWDFDYEMNPAILANGVSFGLEDLVIFAAKPDFATWDDYGARQTGAPGVGDPWSNSGRYWLNARTDDGSGIIVAVQPSLLRIHVPAGSWRGCAPGMANVGARYMNIATGRSVALFKGRLPLVDGVA